MRKTYRLRNTNDESYDADAPGKLGGHCGRKVYGRLDCPSALRWIERGHYVKHRVFFRDEATAIAAGYRPCGCCMREAYRLCQQGDIEQ